MWYTNTINLLYIGPCFEFFFQDWNHFTSRQLKKELGKLKRDAAPKAKSKAKGTKKRKTPTDDDADDDADEPEEEEESAPKKGAKAKGKAKAKAKSRKGKGRAWASGSASALTVCGISCIQNAMFLVAPMPHKPKQFVNGVPYRES